MAGMVTKLKQDGTWVYTTIGAALEMVGLEEIGVYISHQQNTVAQYTVTHPIMDLYLAAEGKPGLCLYRRWWEQTALYILGIREGHEEAGGGGGGGVRKKRRERESRVGKSEERVMI